MGRSRGKDSVVCRTAAMVMVTVAPKGSVGPVVVVAGVRPQGRTSGGEAAGGCVPVGTRPGPHPCRRNSRTPLAVWFVVLCARVCVLSSLARQAAQTGCYMFILWISFYPRFSLHCVEMG